MSRPSVAHILEYVLLRSVTAVVGVLPYRCALGAGFVLAGTSFLFSRTRRREAAHRIREVFCHRLLPSEVRRIAWISWRNMVFSAIELLCMPATRPGWAQKVTDCTAVMETLVAHHRSKRGAILALPHMGSWEMAAATVRQSGIPLFSIAAEQRNRLTSDFINRRRTASGMPVIMRGAGAMRDVLRRLRAGEMLAILPDIRQRTPGLMIDFLGGTANVADGMATLARAAGIPIIPCYVTREGWAHHHFHLLPPVVPDKRISKPEDIARMTNVVFTQLDRVIRRHPEQWFWYNRRWVLDPLDWR